MSQLDTYRNVLRPSVHQKVIFTPREVRGYTTFRSMLILQLGKVMSRPCCVEGMQLLFIPGHTFSLLLGSLVLVD